MTDRTEAQVRAARGNAARSTGPRSFEGKARSSINPTRHGLSGNALVLPGESVGMYRRHQADWFRAMSPTTSPEAQIVQQLGDAAWRLARCSRLEHEHAIATVEVEMQKTEQWKSFSLVYRALTVTNVLVQHFELAATMSPFPTTCDAGMKALVAGADGALDIIREADSVPHGIMEQLETAVDALQRAANRNRLSLELVHAVLRAAKPVQAQLAEAAERLQHPLDELRTKIAAEVAADDDTTRRLGRYRGEIEKSMARLLGVLQQVREQVKVAQKNKDEVDAQPIRFRLRVVR